MARKIDEINNPKSCWNKATDDSIVFVLIDTDESTPGTIRDWVDRRINSEKNCRTDDKMIEALLTAGEIERRQLVDFVHDDGMRAAIQKERNASALEEHLAYAVCERDKLRSLAELTEKALKETRVSLFNGEWWWRKDNEEAFDETAESLELAVRYAYGYDEDDEIEVKP